MTTLLPDSRQADVNLSAPTEEYYDGPSLLDSITSPDDLKQLHPDELPTLASEIRQFLIDSVLATGGHLGSNLGVVEISIALHRVFESPRDVLLWDTGHQAYVHKILTGRQACFEQLRREGGLSGYPCQAESEHRAHDAHLQDDQDEFSHGLCGTSSISGAIVSQPPPVIRLRTGE